MFTLTSKYDKLKTENEILKIQLHMKTIQMDRLNECIEKIKPCIFGMDELNRILSLVHPDKHGENYRSNQMSSIVIEKRIRTRELMEWLGQV